MSGVKGMGQRKGNVEVEFIESDGVYKIPLTRGHFTYVNISDYHLVRGIPWHEHDGYAYNSTLGNMHNILMGRMPGLSVDHIDGDRLNNRRSNLRFCRTDQNAKNRRPNKGFKYKGIYQKKKSWGVIIQGQRLGNYKTEREAVEAYNAEAIKRFGDFAQLNPLPEAAR